MITISHNMTAIIGLHTWFHIAPFESFGLNLMIHGWYPTHRRLVISYNIIATYHTHYNFWIAHIQYWNICIVWPWFLIYRWNSQHYSFNFWIMITIIYPITWSCNFWSAQIRYCSIATFESFNLILMIHRWNSPHHSLND